MLSPSPEELASVLLKRFECLRAIVEQPQDKRELTETLDMPRSTLDAVVHELDRVGFVEYVDGLWRLTYVGRAAYHIQECYLEQLLSLGDASPMLDVLHADSEVSWEFIDGADIHETHPGVPDAVVTRFLDYVDAARDVRHATPRLYIGHGERLYRSGTSGNDSTFEIIAPMEVYEWIHTRYPTATSEALDHSRVSALHAPVPVSFGLTIFDDERAGVTIFSERGIAGLVVNDTDDALAWAVDQYDRMKRAAEPVLLRGAVIAAAR